MTSLTKSFNSLSDAIYLAELHKKILSSNFLVTRVKIESCPRFVQDTNTGYHYCEIHVPCYTDKLNFDFTSMLKYKPHISKIEFKENITFLTFRDGGQNIDDINTIIKKFQSMSLVSNDFKHHWEYAVYDSNIQLDDEWVK